MRSIVRAIVVAVVIAQGALAAGALPQETLMASTASPVFASAHDAETYLAHALPKATRSNPKYLTMKDGSRSEWLTKSVSVSPGSNTESRSARNSGSTRIWGMTAVFMRLS